MDPHVEVDRSSWKMQDVKRYSNEVEEIKQK